MSVLPAREAQWRERTCPLCLGGRPLHEIGMRSYDVATRRKRFQLRLRDCVCTGCGFVMAGNVPDDGFLGDYYAGAFLRVDPREAGSYGFDCDFRIATLKSHLPEGARVLEVGAGDGAFVEAMKESGFRAEGVDLVESDRATSVGQGSYGDSPAAASPCDAVVSYYTLEHLADPRRYFTFCKSRLAAGGIAVIEVPNLATFPDAALHHEHLSYFTDETLTALAEACGFKAVSVQPAKASRHFGQTLVAKLEDPERDRAVSLVAESEVAGCVDRARKLVEIAASQRASYRDAAESLVARMARECGGASGFDLVVWGANAMATEIGFAAAAAGIENCDVVDGSPSKMGHAHDGYARPIRSPKLPRSAARHRAIVICTQAWQDSIRKDLGALGLEDVSIYAAFSGPDNNSTARP